MEKAWTNMEKGEKPFNYVVSKSRGQLYIRLALWVLHLKYYHEMRRSLQTIS
jgi:hypothetical protein